MPWVRRHRRSAPYSWFRSTTVQSHYRRSPASVAILPIVIVVAVILLIIVIF